MAEDAERNLLSRANDVEETTYRTGGLGKTSGIFCLGMAHFLLARSYRHLGDADRAAKELHRCSDLVERPGASSPEREALLPILEAEARTQSS